MAGMWIGAGVPVSHYYPIFDASGDIINIYFFTYTGTHTKIVDWNGKACYYDGPVSAFNPLLVATYNPATPGYIYVPPVSPGNMLGPNVNGNCPIVALTNINNQPTFIAIDNAGAGNNYIKFVSQNGAIWSIANTNGLATVIVDASLTSGTSGSYVVEAGSFTRYYDSIRQNVSQKSVNYNVSNNTPTKIAFTSNATAIYIAYNEAGEELVRNALTYSISATDYRVPTQALTTLSYSFAPIVGLRRIRYIWVNASISQIRVFDANGVNVSNGKVVISNQLDLAQEYELIQFVCTSAATTTTITFLDAFQIQQDQKTVTGTSINIDLRTTTRFVALPTQSSTTTTDTSVTGFISGRYVRIENASPGVAFSITTPNIYDIYGKNLVVGKPIETSTPSTDYGASWEIDLGQEYPIRDIMYSGSINAVAIYNRYRAESWRNYTNSTMTAPLLPVPVPATTTWTALRYIRIVGACTINHVAAIDTYGIDVAICKPVRKVSGTAVTYHSFNGLYASGIVNTGATGDRLEIDLGMSSPINNIKVYLTGTNPTVTVYNELGNTVTFTGTSFLTTIPTTLQPYPNGGIKTRYIGITTAADNAQINNLVVVDSLGRNLAFKNSAKSSNGNFIDNFGKTYNGTTAITLPTTYTELDLGQEHSITSVSVYSTYTGTPSLTSLPTANRTLQGASVTLMDAYYNRVPRTLAGLGSQYNNTWPLGASLGPYYQSPPTGVTVVPGTDGAIWSFPTTEKIIETCVTSVPTTIHAMVVSSTDTIYYTTNNGVYKVSVTQSITHPNSVFISNSNLRAIALSNDETQLWICSPSENKVYAYNTSDGSLLKVFGGATTTEGLSCQLNTADRPIPSPAPTVYITNCSFNNPFMIIMDSSGFVYVGDGGNVLIRKITPSSNSVSTYYGDTVCEQKESEHRNLGSVHGPGTHSSHRMCSTDGWVHGHSSWRTDLYAWVCPPEPNYKIIRIEAVTLSAYFSSWNSLKVGSIDPIFNIEDFGTITSAPAYTDGYYDVTLPTGITQASSFGPGKFVWPGIESPIRIEPNSKGRLERNKIRQVCNKKSNSNSNSVLSTIYFHDIKNNTIRRSRELARTGYCEANLSTPPANSFALTKTLNRTPYSADTTVSSAHVIPISGNYPATTNTALYPNGTQAAGRNNQYYTLPDRPFAGPYNNSTNLPLVDPTAQHFVTATFSETLNFSPPTQPTFTITSVTNTNFLLTLTSRGSDYATSYTYSLNGGAAQVLTLSAANTATIPNARNSSIVIIGQNADGSTPSVSQNIQLPVLPAQL
jgi:hypothetical protein